MVGSGFSRNAESKHPGGLPMPTWRRIAEEICHRLYPHENDKHSESAVAASFETSGALRLAQEYKAAFGPADLHSLLLSLIRDDEFKPGRMHKRLLRLPWRDVFTTNWDTVLERACSTVAERSYGLMRTADEIPLTSRPRIVKLHGSVDAHFPLIITEEDYRTYPVQFAPFVNTVQQAMMETVFCLIGFSGDDPNFLHWSGWVRDSLGTAAPKIYLAGWLNLSIHRRRMLEDRNVVPIDLAHHPKAAQWPEELRHERSTDWILHTLEYGRPYDPSNWPSTSGPSEGRVPKYLEPVHRKSTREPKAEPTLGSDESAENKKAAVLALLDVWNHNRSRAYPGWLTAPSGVRAKISPIRERASLIFETIPSLSAAESLNALRELLWRWEIQLEPISNLEPTSSNFEKIALDVLTLIDCEDRKIDGKSETDVDWTALSEAWVAVGFAVARAARFRFDEEEFNKRLLALSPFQDKEQDIEHRIRHERCLWAIYALNFSSLEHLIEEWHTNDCDPIWMMRKAALQFEIGQNEKARELNSAALVAIRSAPPDDYSVALYSREAWALYCAGATLNWEDFWQASMEWQRRWEELTAVKCNAPLEMRHYAEAMRGESHSEKGAHFDLGMVWKPGMSFSRAESLRWLASHRFVRAAEVLGLPPCVSNRAVASQNLELAARQLRLHEPELAARIVLRAASYDQRGTLNYVLSRELIAIVPQDAVNRLTQDCVAAIDFILTRISRSDADHHWKRRLPVIVECLSRFVLRLDSEDADSVVSKALRWYEHKSVAANVQMREPIGNILSRSWEALSIEQKSARVLDLLSAPIVGMDGFRAGTVGADGKRSFERQYPDPTMVLDKSTTTTLDAGSRDEPKWNEIIGSLARGLQINGEARRRAALRLSWLLDLQPLTEDERSVIALALWGEDYASHEKLPAGTDIYDWAFSVLPEPKPGLAEKRFRAKWLNADVQDESAPPTLDAILWHVGSAIGNLRIHGKPLSFTAKEKSFLVDTVERWAQIPIPPPLGIVQGSAPIFAGGADDVIRNAISGLKYVLLEIEIPEVIANSLYAKVQDLNTSEMPARAVLVGLTEALPKRFDDIVQSIRMGLASDDEETAKNAAQALEFWLRAGRDRGAGFRLPPMDLVREIGVIVATRRKAALIQALNIARWVYMEGESEHRSAIGKLAAQGLGYLEEQLRYDVDNEEEFDVPLLRWGCTQLAIAMAESGFDSEPTVVRWIESAKNDPLPEIRYAIGSTGAYIDVG